MRIIFPFVTLVALAACAQQVPDSGAGVGFQDYGTYQEQLRQRESQLAGRSYYGDEAPDPRYPGQPLPQSSAIPAPSTTASPSVVEPAAGRRRSISDEQNFEAVKERETIESDAERLARQRAQYQVIPPKPLPSRNGNSSPNVVEYALSTTNMPGQQVYRRSWISFGGNHAQNCARYGSADMAQLAFLANGGPQKDRENLDPDGDGFACSWDPTPFRNVAGR